MSELNLSQATAPIKYTAKDFQSDQDVRWCPGCGDYAILASISKVLPELNVPHEKFAFISGIGCSSRFPYYASTYGFHTIHGRATAIASGVKIANPDLSVWVFTGDGDGLSIGGNHFIHLCRRNLDINIILFNNEIYGLTKGQFSPTSLTGQITKSSPMGNLDHPFNPLLLALGAEATFVARSMDRDQKHLQNTLLRAAQHKGVSFVEIYQNCVVFNDGAFSVLTEKDSKDDHVIFLEHGKPLIYGKNKDHGIRLDHHRPVSVSLADGGASVNDLLVYDETDPAMAFMVATMSSDPDLPRPMGVFLNIDRPTFEAGMEAQIATARTKIKSPNLETLFNYGETWEING